MILVKITGSKVPIPDDTIARKTTRNVFTFPVVSI